MEFDNEQPYSPSLTERMIVALLQSQGAPKDVKYIRQPFAYYDGGVNVFRFTAPNGTTQDITSDLLTNSPVRGMMIGVAITELRERGMLQPVSPIAAQPAVEAPAPQNVDDVIGLPVAGHPGFWGSAGGASIPAKGTERETAQGKFAVEMVGTPPMAMMLWKKVS